MGKTVAYVATAILLGIVAMLPLIVLIPERADHGYYAFGEYMLPQRKADVEGLQSLEGVEAATGPSGPFHIGLILVIGFAFASGVSFYFKRKIS